MPDPKPYLDPVECDGCGQPWPLCSLEKCPVTGDLVCPDCQNAADLPPELAEFELGGEGGYA